MARPANPSTGPFDRLLSSGLEEDVSRLLGDIAAHRLFEAGRAIARWQQRAAGGLVMMTGEYLVQEVRVVVDRSAARDRAQSIDELAAATAALEQRIRRLESAG